MTSKPPGGDGDRPIDVDLSTLVAPPTQRASAAVARAMNAEVSGPNQRLPQRLGRYTLVKRLGIGGMAEVFLAEQEGAAGFKKTCVVKRMLPHLAVQERFVEMFLREAQLAADLHHPHIIQIWDLGEVDGTFFIAMEHVDGLPMNTLARAAWRAKRPIPTEVICCALVDAAEGLAYAHTRPSPIVHRDISPDNLMMDGEGMTKILDFGIARVTTGERTSSGELKGKVPFMPPEQLSGRPLDGRVDIYALGITAYWLLTGKRPFTGATEMLMMQSILHDPPRPPIEHNPRIPEGLNALVLRMIEKDPEQRVASARDVVKSLEHVLNARRSVVAPFVRDVIALPHDPSGDDPPSHPSGFLPSTPHTDTLKIGWQRLHDIEQSLDKPHAPPDHTPLTAPLVAPARTLPLPANTGVDNDAELIAALSPKPGRALVAAAAVVVALVVAAVVGWQATHKPAGATSTAPTGELTSSAASTSAAASTASTTSTPSTPSTTSTPVQSTAVASTAAPSQAEAVASSSATVASPSAAVASSSAAVASSSATVASPSAVVASSSVDGSGHERHSGGGGGAARSSSKRSVAASGPANVQWVVDGKVVGTGKATLPVPAGTKQVVAVDRRRGARTTLVIVNDAVDYAKAPHGTLQPRAKPFADVFLGEESLGATPFPPVDVVAGTYKVRFVYKGKEEIKVVEVSAGSVVRPTIDFTGAGGSAP